MRSHFLLLLPLILSCVSSVQAELPNIVVILTDDQGYADISLNPHHPPEVSTPHMDALAKDGVVFTQGYISGSVCSPTRAGLMLGQYQQRVGVYSAGDGGRGFDPTIPIFPATLPKGYVSAALGKWHLGLDDDYPELKWHALSRGFDESYGFMGRGGHDYFNLRSDSEEKFAHPMYRNKERINDEGYLTDRLSEEAVAFIERNKSRPFFLYLAYNAVHAPPQAPEDTIKLYRDRFPDLSEQRVVLMAMLKHLDDGVGAVVDKLKREGLFDNTLLFFLTDNGGAAGMGADNTPLRGFKSSLYEGGIRTPFIVSWPEKFDGGKQLEVPVISLDILPTVLEAVGAPGRSERAFDGKSILPLISGERRTHHEILFWSEGPSTGECAVRRGDWKLHVDKDQRQLFNLAQDPGEEQDVAAQNPQIVNELSRAFDQWLAEMIDPITGGSKRWRRNAESTKKVKKSRAQRTPKSFARQTDIREFLVDCRWNMKFSRSKLAAETVVEFARIPLNGGEGREFWRIPLQSITFAARKLELLKFCKVVLVLGLWMLAASNVEGQASRPNVLFIVCDDLNTHVSTSGYPHIRTPAFDELAQSGMTLQRAYCQYPVCGPSRASFLTGLYPESTGVLSNKVDIRETRPGTKSMPQCFKENGYWTGSVGKVFHSPSQQPGEVAWDQYLRFDNDEMPHVTKARAAFEKEHGSVDQGRARRLWREHSLTLSTQTRGQQQPGYGPSGLRDDQHRDGKNVRQVAEWLDGKAYGNKPFFIACGIHKPHVPFLAPDAYFNMYPKEDLKFVLTPSGFWDQAPHGAMVKRFEGFGFKLGIENDALRREYTQAYHACISFIDAQIGLLFKGLQRNELWDNTIVVLTSDHGYQLGEHFMWGKVTLFEVCNRVPLVIRAPGVTQAGSTSEGLVELIDLFPTLAQLCDVTVPDKMQGRSIVPVLDRRQSAHREFVYTVVTRGSQLGRAIRTDRWRYAKWSDGEELYDLEKDVNEFTNLAKSDQHAEILESMRSRLEKVEAIADAVR